MTEAVRRCEGKRKNGGLCRAQAMSGSHFCVYHNPDLTEKERARIISPKWAQAADLRAEVEALRAKTPNRRGKGS